MTYTLHLGDCRDVLKTLPAESIDAIVSDPPYGLSFMGKEWDHGVPGVAFWVEALRVLKPGGHLLAFGGTRTYHRLAVAIEDAGFEIRDCLQWIYGSGFPKSHDVSKAIDKQAGAVREMVKESRNDMFGEYEQIQKYEMRDTTKIRIGIPQQDTTQKRIVTLTAPATDAAKAWHGWGTALKPSWEPIVMARKPLRGTVADNVQAWGTGAINIDGCRIDHNEPAKTKCRTGKNEFFVGTKPSTRLDLAHGRWPANTLLDEEAAAMVDEQSGVSVSTSGGIRGNNPGMFKGKKNTPRGGHDDTGGASRFFYVAKASAAERDAGLEDMEEKRESDRIKSDGVGGNNPRNRTNTPRQNHHPTVKPIDLMRYLVRMVTPPGGVVLDPFMGSGSTGCAAVLEGFDFIGIDITPEYVEIAERRIAYWGRQPRLL